MAIYKIPMKSDKVLEGSNWFSFYVHEKVSKFEGTWIWYFNDRVYYGVCAWIAFGRCL